MADAEGDLLDMFGGEEEEEAVDQGDSGMEVEAAGVRVTGTTGVSAGAGASAVDSGGAGGSAGVSATATVGACASAGVAQPRAFASVRHSPAGGGRGVFANRVLTAGCLISSEKPVISWPPMDFSDADDLGRVVLLLLLDAPALLATHNLHPTCVEDCLLSELEEMRSLFSQGSQGDYLAQLADMGQVPVSEVERVALVLRHNGFGSGLYAVQSMVNHACLPNCLKIVPLNNRGPSEIWTVTDVGCEEELTICYVTPAESAALNVRQYLGANHGFECSCGECVRLGLCEGGQGEGGQGEGGGGGRGEVGQGEQVQQGQQGEQRQQGQRQQGQGQGQLQGVTDLQRDVELEAAISRLEDAVAIAGVFGGSSRRRAYQVAYEEIAALRSAYALTHTHTHTHTHTLTHTHTHTHTEDSIVGWTGSEADSGIGSGTDNGAGSETDLGMGSGIVSKADNGANRVGPPSVQLQARACRAQQGCLLALIECGEAKGTKTQTQTQTQTKIKQMAGIGAGTRDGEAEAEAVAEAGAGDRSHVLLSSFVSLSIELYVLQIQYLGLSHHSLGAVLGDLQQGIKALRKQNPSALRGLLVPWGDIPIIPTVPCSILPTPLIPPSAAVPLVHFITLVPSPFSPSIPTSIITPATATTAAPATAPDGLQQALQCADRCGAEVRRLRQLYSAHRFSGSVSVLTGGAGTHYFGWDEGGCDMG